MHQITRSSEGTDSGSLPGCPAEVGDSRCVFRMPFGVPVWLLRSVTGVTLQPRVPNPSRRRGTRGPCRAGAPSGSPSPPTTRPTRPATVLRIASLLFFPGLRLLETATLRRPACHPVMPPAPLQEQRGEAGPSRCSELPPAASAGPGVSRACARARRASGRPTHGGTKAAAVATGTENWPGRKRQTRSDGRRLQL